MYMYRQKQATCNWAQLTPRQCTVLPSIVLVITGARSSRTLRQTQQARTSQDFNNHQTQNTIPVHVHVQCTKQRQAGRQTEVGNSLEAFNAAAVDDCAILHETNQASGILGSNSLRGGWLLHDEASNSAVANDISVWFILHILHILLIVSLPLDTGTNSGVNAATLCDRQRDSPSASGMRRLVQVGREKRTTRIFQVVASFLRLRRRMSMRV
jgi:hypothetical protein